MSQPTVSEIKLKPCPWCPTNKSDPKTVTLDGPAHARDDTPYPKHAVECFGCRVRTVWCDTKKEAKSVWNTRAEPPAARQEGRKKSLKVQTCTCSSMGEGHYADCKILQSAEAPEPVSDQLKILGHDPITYLYKEFPATVGHIPLIEFTQQVRDQTASLIFCEAYIGQVEKRAWSLSEDRRALFSSNTILRERVKALELSLSNCRDFIELRKTHSGTVESWRRSCLDEASKLLSPPATTPEALKDQRGRGV